MNALEWSGTILCLIGIGLTSFNIYPVNIFLSLVGSALWMAAGIIQHDTPLALVEGVAVVFYALGVLNLVAI